MSNEKKSSKKPGSVSSKGQKAEAAKNADPAINEAAASSSEPTETQSLTSSQTKVFEISAVPELGFWRCGRKWLKEPCHVVLAEDNADASSQDNDPVFISPSQLERLRCEPNLVVTLLETEE